MVPPDNKMCCSKILSNDRMPYGLPRTRHAHSKREKRKVTHAVGIFSHDSLVDADARVMVDVPGFGEADDRVDKDIGLALSGCAHG